MQSIIRYPHAVPPKVFWEKVFFDAAYQQRLHVDVLGATDFEILEQTGTVETGVKRRVRMAFAADAPAAIRKLVGDSFASVEDGSFDPKTSTFTYRVTPSAMADKLSIGGDMRAEARPDGTMERVVVVDIHAKILGIGKMVEGFIDKQIRDSHAKVRKFTDQWIAEQGLG